VLVVEDDDGIRSLLIAALGREGLNVDAAADGAEALRLCGLHDYSLILLDLMMPRVSGFDFIEVFTKARPQARSVIVVATAFDDGVVETLTSPRIHAVVRKPFDMPMIVNLAREVTAAAGVQPGDQPPDEIGPSVAPVARR
jgi:DNA-binding response OmpR family regulator